MCGGTVMQTFDPAEYSRRGIDGAGGAAVQTFLVGANV